MSAVKTKEEIDIMRKGAEMLFEIMQKVEGKLKPGISTLALDEFLGENIINSGCIPAFKGYNGFPQNTCISLNDEVVHGIPSEKIRLKTSDIVKIDIGLIYKGYYADMARSYLIESKDKKKKALIDTAHNICEYAGEYVRDGMKTGTLGNYIQEYVEKQGYSVVRDYVGHGVGKHLHEEPQVPNFGYVNTGYTMLKGMIICIEPMVNQGTYNVYTKEDGWTVATEDGEDSAHWENMYLVGEKRGYRLTA